MNNNKGDNNKMETSNALNFDNMFDSMFEDMYNNKQEETTNVEQEQEQLTDEEVQKLKENQVNVENTSNVDVTVAVEKLKKIEEELNNDFVEREELIKIMLLAMITNSNLLMLGPPGTGKSKISRAMCNRIDNSNYFEWLLNKASDPSELLGTFSIKGMENDQFKRMTAGKLPEANIAFIDEVYKCNSPTLNALLSIMNEHIFYNDGRPVKVPLISMFAASNEPPEDDSLLAMHDRFLFRMEVEYVHDASNKKKLFNNYVLERAGLSNNSTYTTITIEELEALQSASKKIPVTKAIINNFISMMNRLNKERNISISDRRANECFKILQGSALINGRTKVGIDDFKALKYVLWEKKEDIDSIIAEINKVANPFDDQYNKYLKQFTEIKEKIDSCVGKEKNQTYFQYQNSIKNTIGRINKMIAEASANGQEVDRFMELRNEITEYNANMVNEVLGGITTDAPDVSGDSDKMEEEMEYNF